MEEEVSASFTLPEKYWVSFFQGKWSRSSPDHTSSQAVCQVVGIEWLLVIYPK